ncbi:SCO6880 family protein [Marinactinospora rubrisoli]|uniref:SCO6880 family protein n=1 Tax=Marinactinospora rubrisoli TaxID=2715399 RepID=A0ABW2KN92_9ACTN
MTAQQQVQQRLYGGWRRARSLGLGSLDGRQTLVLVLAIVIPIAAVWASGPGVLLWLGPVAAVVAAAAVTTRDGVWVLDLLLARARFETSKLMGQTVYRGHMWAPYPRRYDLPGPMASTQLIETDVPGRGPVGLVWHQRSGRLSATYLLSPTGVLLADTATVQYQVASWGQVLAGLADDTAIQHAGVTIELMPTSGHELAEHTETRRDPGAPDLVRDVMDQVIEDAPEATTRVYARLTLTVDPSRGVTTVRRLDEGVAETLRSLGGLALTAAGVDVLRPTTATDLVRIVRSAYDPHTLEDTEVPATWDALTWADAGPVAAEEHLDYYAHEGVYSMSWCLLEAPRQHVSHEVLSPLCSPGRYRRRVHLLYRTLSRDEAGRLLEREANSAAAREVYRQRTGRDPSARDRADADRAHRAAAEEAQGAGLVEFSIFVTVTVDRLDQLPEARREVEQAAAQSRLKLRLCRGGQAAAWQTALGVAGIYPADI